MVRRASVGQSRPIRLCIGCRARVPASELLRVVVVGREVVPDPARRLPGRGANVHPDPACLTLAERRRAFGRALRVTGVLDTSPLLSFLVARQESAEPMAESIRPRPDPATR